MARAKRIVAVADVIDKSDLLQPAELEGHYDPHIWFDVALWSKTVDSVVRALAEIDSEGAEPISATEMPIEENARARRVGD